MAEFKQILSGLFQFKGRMTSALFLGIMTIVTGVGLIAASGYLITWAAYRPPILDMILVLVAVRFFGISRAAFRYAERLFSHDLTFRILQLLRVHFFKKITPMLPAKAILYHSGDLLNRFSDDIEQIQKLYLKVIAPTITALFFILATSIVAGLISLMLGLFIFLLMMINAVVMPVLIRYKAGLTSQELSNHKAELSLYLNDHIRGATDLLYSGQYEQWLNEGERVIERISEIQKRRAGAFSMESGLFTLFSHMSIPLTFALLLPYVLTGNMSVLLLTAMVLGIFAVFEALEPMGNALQHFDETRQSAKRVDELSSNREESPLLMNRTVKPFHPEDSSITLSNVTFGYIKRPVIEGVNLALQSGEYGLLRGPSGCGKSTILHLLVKWFEPWSGEILLGGQSISTVLEEEVRQYLSVVSQHTRLFNTSLRNNLKIARSNAADSELMDVLEKVNFMDAYQKLPHGLDTQVGELGLRLSGGERQRIALARALLKNAPVWLLDEPLSNLGTKMSHEIMQTLRQITKGKTVLHITHRGTELFQADRFFEMSDGVIKEIMTTLGDEPGETPREIAGPALLHQTCRRSADRVPSLLRYRIDVHTLE